MKQKIKCLGFLLTIYCLPLSAQINPKVIYKSIVRVEVTVGVNTYMSSGFIWQTPKKENMVVTALHGMRHNAEQIKVICKGRSSLAWVEKVSKYADLVLLKTKKDIQKCIPINRAQIELKEPGFEEKLYAFGYYPERSKSDLKFLEMSSVDLTNSTNSTDDSPKLSDLLTHTIRKQLKNLELPSMEIAVYPVSGVIIKGYSGGPVFNKQGKLIGTVSGGLDKGLSNTNWVMPISNINNLWLSKSKTIPVELSHSENLFSAVSTNPTLLKHNNTENAQTSGSDEPSNSEYRWIKTKTRTFAQLLETADPNLGLGELYLSIIPEQMTAAERQLAFDIYEEESRGLIIAIPKEREMSLENEGDGFIISSMSETGQADIEIRYNAFPISDNANNKISPSHKNYFTYVLDAVLEAAQCHTSETSCWLDRDKFGVVDFGDGNKIARAAFTETTNGLIEYNYLSLVVKGKDAMEVSTIINFDENNSMKACVENPSKESCGQSYWDPVSYMLANAITTFTDFVIGNGNPVEHYDFVYQCNYEYCADTTEENNSEQNQVDENYVELGYSEGNYVDSAEQ
ncbi:MAG: hypothetical protein ACJASL_003608 [Paraglaciecola sp.]|jgi:hypothetical protein